MFAEPKKGCTQLVINTNKQCTLLGEGAGHSLWNLAYIDQMGGNCWRKYHHPVDDDEFAPARLETIRQNVRQTAGCKIAKN